ncbi:MAG: ribonuclease H-like domain-containing protein [bacterium]
MDTHAFLDIETAFDGRLTIVGILRADRGLLQLVGRDITPERVLEFLDGTALLHTYNGHSFDLPRIRAALGVDLRRRFACRDLMRDCWRLNLYGGLKKVERTLGIARATEGVDGMEAMRLWDRYVAADDTDALARLLHYNREDVENLVVLREKLEALSA